MKTFFCHFFSLVFICSLLLSCSDQDIITTPSVADTHNVELSKPKRINQPSYSNYSFVDIYKSSQNGYYFATFYGTEVTFSIGYYDGSWNEGDLACNDRISISPTYSYMSVTVTQYGLSNSSHTKIYTYTSSPSNNDWSTKTFKIIRTHYTTSTFALVEESYTTTNPTPNPTTPPVEE